MSTSHTHQFVRISDVTKPGMNVHRPIYGAEVGCVECGEIRQVFSDGTLKLVSSNESR